MSQKSSSRNTRTGAGQTGPRRRTVSAEKRLDLEALAALSGKVTAMEPQERVPGRRSVYIDGAFAVGLHEETIILTGLKVGRQVDGPSLVAAYQKDLEKRAWDYALKQLSSRARSRKQIEQSLARTYPPETVERVIQRLTGGGWLDDADFARQFIEAHRDRGERRLLQDLQRAGVSRAVAEGVASDLLGDVDPVAVARSLAASRLKRMTEPDRDTAQRRLAGFLGRRGYGFETISQALAPLLAELPRAPRPAAAAMRRVGGLGRRRFGSQPEEE